MDVVLNKDGTRFTIGNDSDFCRMLVKCLGEDAAVWYQGRIARIVELLKELRAILPPEEEMSHRTIHGTVIYNTDAIRKIGTDKLIDVAIIASEIPGWDE